MSHLNSDDLSNNLNDVYNNEYRKFLNHQWQLNSFQYEDLLETEEDVQYYKNQLEQKLYLDETELYCKYNMLNIVDRDEINEIPDDDFTQKATLSKAQEGIYDSHQEALKSISSELQAKLEEFNQSYSTIKNDTLEIQSILQNIKEMETEIEKIESKLNSSKCRAASDAEKLSKIQVNQLKVLGTDLMNEESAVFELKQKIVSAEKHEAELQKEFESLQTQFSLLEQNKKDPDQHLEKIDDWYKKGIHSLYKVNGITDIQVLEPQCIKIFFDISPNFPYLVIKHTDSSNDFYPTEAKIFNTFKMPKNIYKPKIVLQSNGQITNSGLDCERPLSTSSNGVKETPVSDSATIELLDNWLNSPASPKDCSHWLPSFISSVFHHLSSIS